MGPNDESDTTEEGRRNVPGSSGSGAYPPPHQAGFGASTVNPFHLAIAELQADTDDMDAEPQPQPAQAAGTPQRQTIVLTQPVRALTPRNWITIGAISLPCGLIGGLIIASALSSRPPEPVERPPATDPAVVKDLDGLKSRTGDLLKQVDALNQKLSALPPPVPPPDLSELRATVDKLAKVTDGLSATGVRVDKLEQNAKSLTADVESLGSDAKSLKDKLDGLDRTVKAAAVRPAPANVAPVRDEKPAVVPTLTQGADLFKRGRYKDALGIFNKLELQNPSDARIWYFAALSQGLVTNQWGGGTAELVQKGIERERAGSPDSAQIDATFKDLTVTSGKDWLEEYRKRAR